MMHLVLVATLFLTAPAQTLDLFISDATDRLLNGEMMPSDYKQRILALADPADRLQAIIFLRRAGLLKDPNTDLGALIFGAQPTATGP